MAVIDIFAVNSVSCDFYRMLIYYYLYAALPEQIIEVFDGYRLLTVGLKHGTVTVIINKHPVEITTYRIDGEYIDHRILQKSDLLRILPMTLQEGISRLMP